MLKPLWRKPVDQMRVVLVAGNFEIATARLHVILRERTVEGIESVAGGGHIAVEHVIIVSVGTDHLHLLIIEPSGAFAALVGAWESDIDL